MVKESLKIIGINPGTRYMGIALFHGTELWDWRIKVFEGRWTKAKTKKIREAILGFIRRYEPNVIAMKKLHPSRSSTNLKKLVAKIKEISKRRGLKVCQYSIRDLESFFNPEKKINKKSLAEVLASEYPVLSHEFRKEKSNKNAYHVRMFEAVALGAVCFHQLDKP